MSNFIIIIKVLWKPVLGIRDIFVQIRIHISDLRIQIQLLSSVTLNLQKKFHIFSYNLTPGTFSSVFNVLLYR